MKLADLQNIKDTVDKLVEKYETADPWILCERLNIIVLISDLPIGVKGFYQLIKGRQIIHISRWVSNTQMKLVCAHELAHAILHKNQNICHRVGNAKMEKEAEYFKHYLLRLKVNEVSKWSREDISNFTHLSEDMIILDF